MKARAEWALANVLVTWKREVGPLIRKAYKDGGRNRSYALEAAERMEGMARALRAAADPEETDA